MVLPDSLHPRRQYAIVRPFPRSDWRRSVAHMGDTLAATATRTVIYDAGDGWDFLQMLPTAGWRSIRAWGRNGWELGDWPSVVVAVRRCLHTGQVEVCEYVHGDLTITTWPNVDTGHVDGLAAAWWERTDRGPVDPADGRGPFGDRLV
jgi:hypothetical protein